MQNVALCGEVTSDVIVIKLTQCEIMYCLPNKLSRKRASPSKALDVQSDIILSLFMA